MEIRQLEYFLMVSKVNSFTRAAERLYVSQPAVTNAVRTLEDELGIRLFDRSQKHVLLTTEGKIFCAHIEKIMQGISNTLNEINALKDLNSGILRLGVAPLATVAAMRLINIIRDSYPNIKISVRETATDNLQKLLLEDTLDLAVVLTGLELGTLSYIKLSREELVMCCLRQHKFRRFNSISIEELRDENLALIDGETIYRQRLDEVFSTAGITPRVIFEGEHVQTIKSFISEGGGVTILPENLCEFDQFLSTAPLDPPIFLGTSVTYKTNRHHSHAAKAVLNLAKEMNQNE